MTTENIHEIVELQRRIFTLGGTRSVENRIHQLKRLEEGILKYESAFYEALWKDLHKSKEEAFLTEISIVLIETRNAIKNVAKWAKPKLAKPSITTLPSIGYIAPEPLGTALIISPWNYPVNLLFCPLVGALAAGCTAVLKPSPYTPSVSAVCKKMVEEFFPENIVAIIEGNRDVNTLLLKERYDIIFFTGSPKLARVITAAAAPNLTPTILELGGKSPCIVDKEADIKLAAKRIMWGKIINAGQTCIAPDYLFVHAEVKHLLFDEMKKAVDTLLPNIKENNYFPRIVNSKSFKRLSGYLKSGNIIFGGDTDEHERYISPTLIDNVDPESPIMQEEIFGPILPAMTFKDIEEVITFVNSREKPLAFYYFGSTDKGWKVINRTTSGGACLNDVIMHISNSNMPFGGVGNSGMGRYHGKESFLAFSNRRSVLNSVTTIDNPIKYPPFKGVGLLKKIL